MSQFTVKAVCAFCGVTLLAATIPAWVLDECPPKPQSCTASDTHREHPHSFDRSLNATTSSSPSYTAVPSSDQEWRDVLAKLRSVAAPNT